MSIEVIKKVNNALIWKAYCAWTEVDGADKTFVEIKIVAEITKARKPDLYYGSSNCDKIFLGVKHILPPFWFA